MWAVVVIPVQELLYQSPALVNVLGAVMSPAQTFFPHCPVEALYVGCSFFL